MKLPTTNFALALGDLISITTGNHLVCKLTDFKLANTYANGKYVVYMIRLLKTSKFFSNNIPAGSLELYEVKAIHPETEDKIVFNYMLKT